MAKTRMAGDKLKDSTPNEHMSVGIDNYNNADYATDNQYGQDLSGITYKEGIDDHFGGDGSIGGNDVKNMMEAGYSADDIYNFSKKKGLNYNQHGREYLQREGDYDIGKGADQWGDVFGQRVNEPGGGIEPEVDGDPVVPETAPITAGPIEINAGADFGDLVFSGSDSPGQNVVQDNDQTSSVVGNNNTVNQDQNNSVQNFGGSTFNPTDWKKSWMNSKFAA